MVANSHRVAAALKGSIVIVGVGSALGLSAAIARRFGRQGHPVVIAGRNSEKLFATAAE